MIRQAQNSDILRTSRRQYTGQQHCKDVFHRKPTKQRKNSFRRMSEYGRCATVLP